MSASRSGPPWELLLVVVILGMVGHAWFDRADSAVPGGDTAIAARLASAPDPMVRRTGPWAPAGRAVISPGVQTFTQDAGQCTTNFVFTDRAGRVYVGQAAHCARVGSDLDGCRSRTLPLGTRVIFTRDASTYDAGRRLGTGHLAYSSWQAMQRRNESADTLCAYNDFALVRVDGAARRHVNPSMPFWGGPTGLSSGMLPGTEHVFGFGQSSLRRAGSRFAHQAGTTLPDRAEQDGWTHVFYARSPGIPGDSGSGYLDSRGRALGTLSTLMAGGAALWNGLGDLRQELAYARAHSGIPDLRLELGSAFSSHGIR